MVYLSRSVGRSATIVSPAKTAEAKEMPFGIWDVLDGVQIPTREAPILTAKGVSPGHVWC